MTNMVVDMENKMQQTKIFPSFTKTMDAETGIVEAYVSVFGIKDKDDPPDIIQLGAFVKTIQERGPAGARKIRVLNQHWRDEVIGMPLIIVEHSRELLPPELLERFPEATGGLFTRTQFIMEVQKGREIYALYKAGAMDEWSIGFDAMQFEFLKREDDERIRLLKELRLWEYSPVTWGMNQATITTAVKGTDVLVKPHDDALTKARFRAKVLELSLSLGEHNGRDGSGVPDPYDVPRGDKD